jgi:hypothetical protein
VWSSRCFTYVDPLRRCFTFLDSVLLDLYPACAEELYSDVVILILCNSSFIPVLYGFVPLETGIARDSLFLGLSRRCRESGFRSGKFGSFHVVSEPYLTVGRALAMVDSLGQPKHSCLSIFFLISI